MSATDAELGWFAGMLEGEGCIYFHKQSRRHKKQEGFDIIVGATITNTDILLINKLLEILEKCDLSWFVRNKTVYSNKHSECFFIECRSQPMLKKSLEIFIPYMYGAKKAKAELVLKFIIKRDGKRGRNPYTSDELFLIPRDSTLSAHRAEDIVQTA